MSYEKQNFVNDQILTANQLNHIEDGIENLDNVIAEVTESFVRPEDFGAVGDGVTDDTVAFQAAIDACSTQNGSKTILLSQKTYVVGGLNLKRYTRIIGCGWKSSFLKVLSGFNGDLLSIIDQNANYVQLKDFCILGDKDNNTCANGIYMNRQGAIGESDENWRAADAWCIIENVRITNMYGNGINHYRGRECRFNNLNVSNCGGYGLFLQGSDNNYFNITSWCNKLAGYQILDSNSRFINCKSFANGDAEHLSPGFFIGDTMTITMNACEAQENFGHGFHLQNTKDSMFNGMLASTNGLINKGQEELSDSYGFYFEGEVQSIILSGSCNDFRRQSGEPCQKIGIEFGSLMYSTINLIVKNNEINYTTNGGEWIFNEGNNEIVINGSTLSYSVLKGVRLLKNDDTGFNTLQVGGYEDAARYELVGKQGNGVQLDVFKGYTWIGSPLTVSANGAIKLATSNETLGFFGSWGSKKQTSIDDATDLESAIELINNLKAILKAYGLIN